MYTRLVRKYENVFELLLNAVFERYCSDFYNK